MIRNRTLLAFALPAILLVSLAGCKDDSSTQQGGSLNYTYFPTNVGHELIYDAQLIVWDPVSGIDTMVYQIREMVESEFTDNQGRPTQRLERYTRATPADPWVIADVWTSNMTSTRVEKKEENTTFIKLVFPLLAGKTWNGNSLNNFGEQEYIYDFIDEPYTINGLTLDSTLHVIQSDEDNYVYSDHFEEYYAAGIGLVHRSQIHIEWDRVNYPDPNVFVVGTQRLYTEKLVSWSN